MSETGPNRKGLFGTRGMLSMMPFSSKAQVTSRRRRILDLIYYKKMRHNGHLFLNESGRWSPL